MADCISCWAYMYMFLDTVTSFLDRLEKTRPVQAAPERVLCTCVDSAGRSVSRGRDCRRGDRSRFQASKQPPTHPQAQIRMSSTVILVTRHGETEANAQGVLQGQSESALTALGRRQAELLGSEIAKRLAGGHLPPAAPIIYSSDLSRAVDTASAVAIACGGSLQLQKDFRLRERRLGPFQGKTQDECRVQFPLTWASFVGDQKGPKKAENGAQENGGVEASLDMRKRAVDVFEEIALAHAGQTVVVVSHGGLVNAAVGTLAEQRELPHIGNCSISVLRRLVNARHSLWVADTIGESDHVARSARDVGNVDVLPK